jgi:hypothetical protein
MNPPRIVDSECGFGADLLRSAKRETPSPESEERVLVTVGVAAGGSVAKV